MVKIKNINCPLVNMHKTTRKVSKNILKVRAKYLREDPTKRWRWQFVTTTAVTFKTQSSLCNGTIL